VELANAVGVAPATASATRGPAFVESVLAVIAVAALLPSFLRLAADDHGRDRRFADAAITVGGLPDAVLPSLCASYGAFAEPTVRDRLCRRSELRTSRAPPDAIPAPVAEAYAQAARAFRRPLAVAEARRAELRLQQREGLGDLLGLGNAIAAIDADLRPYRDRYMLGAGEGAAPLPLACAFELVRASLARGTAEKDVAPANALLVLGAALDGHGATSALASLALFPRAPWPPPGCSTFALPDALAAGAMVMADARQARVEAAKNEAMRALLRTAGWQWAAGMLAGLVLVKLSRGRRVAFAGTALALTVWAAAAWLGRGPWPFAADRAFLPGRDEVALNTAPAPFVLALAGTALAILLVSPWLSKRLQTVPQTLASRVGYPGLIVATGLGWLLLLDLSANGNFNNRYLALYHHGHLWLGMLALTVVAFVRQPAGRALARALSTSGALAERVRHRLGSLPTMAVAAVAMTVFVAAVGALFSNVPQLTSEIGRAWLIVGASWFFFLRGDPLAERLARRGGSLVSLARYVAPLLAVVGVLVGVQLVTRDMGPLLIASYGAGAFVAAAVAMWWQQRTGTQPTAFVLAVAMFVAWIFATTFGLFELGAFHEVTAGRLENLAAPLASANDQLALVTWFQRAAPADGFGLGAVPWCGYAGALGCPGVPAQIQSDYTLTALVGAFGWTAAWAATIGCALWLHRLIRHHGRVTRGEPRLIVAASGRVVNDDQALLSWLAVTWVVLTLCQLAVTVAGNLAVLPLTGVTFPFVSFGMTSLVGNMALLGLAINVNRGGHG